MAGPSCGLGFDESTGPIELTCPLDSLIVLNKVFHLFFVIRVSFPSLSFNFCVVVVTIVVVDWIPGRLDHEFHQPRLSDRLKFHQWLIASLMVDRISI